MATQPPPVLPVPPQAPPLSPNVPIPSAAPAPAGAAPGAKPGDPNAKVVDPKARKIGPDGKPVPEGEEHHLEPQLTFWQKPWVQNVLPFVTSLALHAGIIILGYAAVEVVRTVANLKPNEEMSFTAESGLVEEGVVGGVQFQGIGGDPTRPAAQDEYTENTVPDGWAPKPGDPTKQPELIGGGDGAGDDSVIGLSATGGGFGHGKGLGSGKGDARGSGTGDGTGPLAPFGTPGGGGIGPKSKFMGVSSGARTIVYVCDASGSMINKFATLKQEMVKAIQNLKSIQGFSIVFFQDDKAAVFSPTLQFATPENKRKAFAWLEEVSTTGTSDPMPGLEAAFKMKPQLVFILTDGDFPDNAGVRSKMAQLNSDKKTKVNTIAFVSSDDEEASQSYLEFMKQLATEHAGVFKHVREDELNQ